MNNNKKYSLLTAIAMIVGIVIGSGIFFKADDVLTYTSGNVILGVIVFTIAATAIIFGCLSISQLAKRSENPGGIISYMEENWSKASAGAVGWFHAFVYYPSLVTIVAWVSGIYIIQLFGLQSTLELQMLIGLISALILFIFNTMSAKIGGYLQVSSTIIKLIPLIGIAIAGVVFGDPGTILSESSAQLGANPLLLTGAIAAIAPIAFSFDGWIISTSISNEIKNSKRNLPIALTLSPLFILAAYVLYFVGVSALLGPQKIIELGDNYLYEAANMLLGPVGAKIVLTFVVVSVLGTLNGLILGTIRLPYSLALRNMFPMSDKLRNINPKSNISKNSAIVALIIAMAWYIVHYFTMKFNLLPGSDVSEIAIITNYLCFIALYVAVIKLTKKGLIKSKFFGYICPVLAIIGSLIIFSGAFLNPIMFAYIAFSAIVMIIAYIYCKAKAN